MNNVAKQLPYVVLDLTEEQMEVVRPLIDKANTASAHGRRGMIMAQVYSTHMRVGFVEHDAAQLIRKEVNPS